MIGNKCLLTNLQPFILDFVTFRDGAKGSVLGSSFLNVLEMPKLRDVLLAEGLKANMINISQLYYQNHFVKFTKDRCTMLDQNWCYIMEGNMASNNCYLLANTNTRMNTV